MPDTKKILLRTWNTGLPLSEETITEIQVHQQLVAELERQGYDAIWASIGGGDDDWDEEEDA